jgi:hypothetical protein
MLELNQPGIVEKPAAAPAAATRSAGISKWILREAEWVDIPQEVRRIEF